MNLKTLNEKAKAYALKNAVAYNGVAKPGAVISGLFHEGLVKKEVSKFSKQINEIVLEVNKLSAEEQKKELSRIKKQKQISERKGRKGLSELPKAKKGKVVMRIAPSASGPLHVGHALVASLSWDYVKKYSGKFFVRIEDTNPENVYKDSYKLIKEDAKWLFNSKAKIAIQSERMKLYYKYAEKLIENKSAYVCTCPSEKFKKFVETKEECPCRNLNAEENKFRWEKMLSKNKKNNFNVGGAVLRFKTEKGMQDENPAMRDFPLARINEMKHPLQGKKFRVWPLMNLAVSVDDISMKMTHVIRGKDHRDNAKRQEMIYRTLGKSKAYPWVGFLGKIHFEGFELSTSKMREGIENKKFSGWSDKNLPTVASLRKQGFKPEAFHKLAEHIGLSEKDKTISKEEYFELLKTFSKQKYL